MKKNEITEFPQQSIDLMFWQYMQGVADVVNEIKAKDPNMPPFAEKMIQALIKAKKARIKQFYNDREPSFDLTVHNVKGKIEVRKLTA